MAMDATIRLARMDDLPALLALYALLDVGSEAALPLAQAQAKFRELLSCAHHEIHVAQSGPAVVGTFALIFIGGLPHHARDSCIVEDVVVAAARQGQGLGRQMMQFARQRSAERSCYKLVLSSHVERLKAHRFYESLGFDRHGYSFLVAPPAGSLQHAPGSQ